jgi:hypothetical protein
MELQDLLPVDTLLVEVVEEIIWVVVVPEDLVVEGQQDCRVLQELQTPVAAVAELVQLQVIPLDPEDPVVPESL